MKWNYTKREKQSDLDRVAIQMMKNSTRQTHKYISQTKYCCVFFFFSKGPSLLPFHCLAEFFSGTLNRLPPICKQTSSLTSYWLAGYVTSALDYKATPTTVRSSERGKGGRDGGGGRRRKVMTEAGGEEERMEGRELTHMWQDRAVLLMGREKYDNLNKRGFDGCAFSSLRWQSVIKQAGEITAVQLFQHSTAWW